MKLPTFIQNKRIRNTIIIYSAIIIAVLIIVLIILFVRQDQEEVSVEPIETIVSIDPVSGEEITNAGQEPEIVDAPLYLGMDILYARFNAEFVRSVLLVIEDYADEQSIALTRVSMVMGSFDQSTTGSAVAQDLTTTTNFDIVLNIDQQELNVEIVMPFFGDTICTLRNTDGQILFQRPVDTAN